MVVSEMSIIQPLVPLRWLVVPAKTSFIPLPRVAVPRALIEADTESASERRGSPIIIQASAFVPKTSIALRVGDDPLFQRDD